MGGATRFSLLSFSLLLTLCPLRRSGNPESSLKLRGIIGSDVSPARFAPATTTLYSSSQVVEPIQPTNQPSRSLSLLFAEVVIKRRVRERKRERERKLAEGNLTSNTRIKLTLTRQRSCLREWCKWCKLWRERNSWHRATDCVEREKTDVIVRHAISVLYFMSRSVTHGQSWRMAVRVSISRKVSRSFLIYTSASNFDTILP